MARISLLIVDRERAFGQLLARSLHALPEMSVVACTQTLAQAERVVAAERPDVVVLDAGLSPRRLVAVAAHLRATAPCLEFVVTSGIADPDIAYEAVLAGARAFVSKRASLAEMREAVVGAVLGETWIEPALLTGVLDRLLDDGDEDEDVRHLASLTRREAEILELMVDGLDQPRIARALGLSVNTVRTHTQNILTKLEVHSRLEAVSVALHAGFPGRRRRHPSGGRGVSRAHEAS